MVSGDFKFLNSPENPECQSMYVLMMSVHSSDGGGGGGGGEYFSFLCCESYGYQIFKVCIQTTNWCDNERKIITTKTLLILNNEQKLKKANDM